MTTIAKERQARDYDLYVDMINRDKLHIARSKAKAARIQYEQRKTARVMAAQVEKTVRKEAAWKWWHPVLIGALSGAAGFGLYDWLVNVLAVWAA